MSVRAARNSTAKRMFPSWLGFVVTAGAFCALLWTEYRRPLRRETESKRIRQVRNLVVALLGATATSLVERPLALKLAGQVEERRSGLLKQVRLPLWLETAVACVLLDYTLYLWHYLTHKVGFLWRFHVVHHADLDLDLSTALRFHFGELLLSVPFRLTQIRVLGVSPLALTLWQTLLFVSVMFHHSNVRLRLEWERRLNRFIVTPRMHGIHHSMVREETDSNWSSGLTLWDSLHGTLQLNVQQQAITIGVPAYCNPEQVTIEQIISMPFAAQPDSWQLPDGEGRSVRQEFALPTTDLQE